MNLNITLEGYINYYGSPEYQDDLKRYFKVEKSYTRPQYNWIGFASSQPNPPRVEGCPSSSREKNFYFSFCLFFRNLQAQGIYILSGRKMMNRFHAETGVPMISCGMGGVMHPAHVLFEAGLLPQGEEILEYIKMIDVIMPAIYPQIAELKAYADIEELYSLVENEILRFRHRLEKGEPHPTHLAEHI